MVKLEPHKTCPYGSFCGHKHDGICECQGLNPERPNIFICELWAENYEDEILKKLEE